jgi:hypothetical protein
MKVFEILRDDVKTVTEQEVIARMRAFNWSYEYDESFARQAWGARELELIENMVYQLWKNEPDRAVQIWNENVDTAPADKTVVPSFIFRLQAQEK